MKNLREEKLHDWEPIKILLFSTHFKCVKCGKEDVVDVNNKIAWLKKQRSTQCPILDSK